jgi:hypothetical protein
MEVKNMEEKTMKEIEAGAKILGLTTEEANQKFAEICSESHIETDNPIGLGLWRNYVANVKRSASSGNKNNQSGDSLYKLAFGFFVSLEAPRDMMSWNRNRAKEEYLRDENGALEKGFVAVATENALGKFTVSRYHNGNYEEVVVDNLHEGAETLEDGRIYIPLDNTATYASGGQNKNYGRPLPKEQMRRSGVFYGSLNGEEMKSYFFSYKGDGGVNFAPNTFEWVHFLCIPNDAGTDIYGATDKTINSLIINANIDPEADAYRNMDSFNFESALQENFEKHITALVEIDKAHIMLQSQPSKERFIITDGTVCNMNMTPTKNGNRIINITDLNAEIDFESDAMTTCWIPEHLSLDFGIGSSVIVVGRTSQRMVDGEAEPVTINVAGIHCVEKVGSPVESAQPVEKDYDWF